ncbi:MAG: 4Fe-4S dicluster domain-containing protein [Coprothermobacterota bacterium]|nr:4Fe-4S dicluster domain-containing protein [Coprothermobacterota bacterium]
MLFLKLARKKLLEALKEFPEYSFYTPKKEGERVLLKETSPDGLPEDLRFERSTASAKELLFPQAETMFYFLRYKPSQKPVLDEGKRLILGLRPCDAHGIQVLEANFLKVEPIDPYFKRRRENTLLVTVACSEFEDNCFCDSLGSGPDRLNGADAIIYDLSNAVGVLSNNEIISQRLKDYTFQIQEVRGEDEAEKGSLPQRTVEPLPILSPEEYLSLILEEKLWDKISSTCLGCASCTYLCPTCYCFDIQDINYGPAGKRIRTYDSCMFNLYTLEASGHNPRPTLKERWRQRFLHKFSYIPYLHGILGCTGCGRCIEVCPAGIDMHEVIKDVAKFPR